MTLEACRLVLSRNHIDLTTVVPSIYCTANLLRDVLIRSVILLIPQLRLHSGELVHYLGKRVLFSPNVAASSSVQRQINLIRRHNTLL